MAKKATYYGVNPPFIGGVQNVLSRQVDERLIKNDILQLVLTLPGERVYRPNFGTRLRAIVFDSLTDGDLGSLARDIQQAILDNDERVSNLNVVCANENEGQSVRVRIEATIVTAPLTKFLVDLTFNQSGAVTLAK